MIFKIKNKTDVYTKQNYPLKSIKSLQYTCTSKEDWKLAEVKQKTRQEVNQNGISFIGYSHLQESTPFTDSLIQQLYDFKKTNGCVHAYAKIDATGAIIPETNALPEWAESNCEFCGKLINKPHIIICEKKRIFLRIGSECRKQFTDAEDPLEQINTNIVMTLRKLLVEKGWQSKIIEQICTEQVYRKNTEQSGKFYPHKLYADVKKLVLELGYLQIPPDDEEPKIIPVNLKESSDKKIIKIWQLARKVFTLRNPTFLNDISDYVNRQKWNV